ncbi:oxidoreductase (plasmid) [Burkholderia sp. SFA1]|uniref:SDR family NAD(P)-dependent oxidoreductase n=1 Tax=unclassified Caballeronia TaxID=2646786 RepID=UPI001F1764D3|nr:MULTISPECIES: SDR family oxidoreductase [unclassified Caballeronia]MCE4546777.1 SDR family oxidoreductase [Caballeronia sp. PC1]MCE4572750.1 SDR family oxidoreductase [Caballeronia sp. CLC5]BBQ01875.1 oxidoreductase [Burkholderia sp. SFA1]
MTKQIARDHTAPHWLGLESSTCVVTGAAGGIGRAIATTFADAGARLALLDRDEAGCHAAADALRANGADVIAVACDIADPASVNRARDQVERRFGHADVLVNNAGLLRAGGIEDIGLDAWNAMLAVNLTGYMLCAQAFGRGMLARGAGSIVHIASVAAHHPQTWSGAYSPSKAGIAMLSRQIAAEWGARGVRSNAVCPGMIRTPLSKAFYEQGDVEARRSAMTASRRIGEPRDIAEVVAFLASHRAAYVNGAELAVDGGFECMLMDLVPRPGFEAARTV